MPAKEIKELRVAGKLNEAYDMAKAELNAEPENIWGKRNLSWVLYAQMNACAKDLPIFLAKIKELKELTLPASEDMLFENICIVIAKAVRFITKPESIDLNKVHQVYDAIKPLPLNRNSKWFTVLYSAFHKGFKESHRFIEFADWWNFENFQPEAFLPEKMLNGKEMMAVAEQAYIAYAKHLLPQQNNHGEVTFNKEKAIAFLPVLTNIVDNYPAYQYPAYFKAKLLLALGDTKNILSELLLFAKKKQNEFWVWNILAEAFSTDEDKVFACHCRALTCNSPEEMLVKSRLNMAINFISKNLYNEAKTEIELLVKARELNGWRISNQIINWQSEEWYKNAIANRSNYNFYKNYTGIAESLLFSDVPEVNAIVDYVNKDKGILNFISSETIFGFFKYDKFFGNIKIGDVIKVRIKSGSSGSLYKIYTAEKAANDEFKNKFYKTIEGKIRIPEGKNFGFLGDVYVHPNIVSNKNLTTGMDFNGIVIKSFDKSKNQWGWKML